MWNLLKGLRERGVNLLAGALLCWAGFRCHPEPPAAPCSATALTCAGTDRHTSDLRGSPTPSSHPSKNSGLRFAPTGKGPELSPLSFPNSLSSCAFPKEKEQGAGEIRAVIMWTGMFSGWNYSGHLGLSKQPQTFFKLIFLMVKQQTHTLIKAFISLRSELDEGFLVLRGERKLETILSRGTIQSLDFSQPVASWG